MRYFSFGSMLLILLLALSACAKSEPAATIEAYLRAKVDSDLNALLRLSCSDWEGQATIEAGSFESMNAELQNMACRQGSTVGDYSLVECQGIITTVYNGERREWDLGAFPYKLRKEDGEWRMCGYYEAAQ
jgi:hypothetical protein